MKTFSAAQEGTHAFALTSFLKHEGCLWIEDEFNHEKFKAITSSHFNYITEGSSNTLKVARKNKGPAKLKWGGHCMLLSNYDVEMLLTRYNLFKIVYNIIIIM